MTLPNGVAVSYGYDAANRMTARGLNTLIYDANGNLTGDGTNSYSWNARDQLSGMTGASFAYDAGGRRRSKTVGGTGMVTAAYTYEAFGGAAASGAAASNLAGFTGRENDGTGLMFYRARYYSPGLQRLISEDPLGFGGGDVNLYAYVGNGPTNDTDPTGEAPWEPYSNHWVPQAVRRTFRDFLEPAANSLPYRWTSGGLGYHCWTKEQLLYNNAVETLFRKFIADNNISIVNKMTTAQVKEFSLLLWNSNNPAIRYFINPTLMQRAIQLEASYSMMFLGEILPGGMRSLVRLAGVAQNMLSVLEIMELFLPLL